MKTRTLIKLGMIIIALATVAGCGENTVVGTPTASTLADSQPCIGCHGTAVSPVTGAVIADEWKLSRHNTEAPGKKFPGFGAGCRDCHEPEAGHPNNCGRCHGGPPAANNVVGLDVSDNPDRDLKCFKCHHTNTLGAPHFNNMTSGKYPASYVSSQYIGNCRKCHNPHDPSSKMAANIEWGESGHGDTTAPPWTNYDFKTRGTAGGATPANSVATDCVRCHTTTGYINYVSSNFTDIHAWASTTDSKTLGKQVLGCNACHDDGRGNAYGFQRRTVPAVTGYYNYSSKATAKLLVNFPFPNVATSNICMACHTGRESGRTIKAIEAVEATSGTFRIFSSAAGISFINSHYLTAGATVFKASGYEYPGRDYTNLSFYKHDHIGVNNTEGTGTNGPCVGCHMSSTEKHTFLPVKKDETTGTITAITSQMCVRCHNGQHALTETFLQQEKDGFNAALATLAKALKVRGFTFTSNHPYFSNKNWQTDKGTTGGYGAGTGGPTMGSAFNFNLLRHDFGAFAHNRIYTKRLIYDSIDWIDDGQLNLSVETSLNNPLKIPDDPALVYNLDGTTVNLDAAMKAKALAYLQGTSANPSGVGGTRP